MSARYRKISPVVEAVQFNGVNHDEVTDFCHPHPLRVGGNFTLILPIPPGDVVIRKGDWILKSQSGDVYPCKEAIFYEDYEVAPRT